MNPTFHRLLALGLIAGACSSPSSQVEVTVTAQDPSGVRRLPTGARLDPAGVSHDLGSMPLAMALSPEKDRIVVLLNGWREQGIQVVERSSGRVLQTIPLPAVFLGIAFSPDGRSLYVSGGDQDVVYRFDWRDGAATLADSIALAVKEKGKGKDGTRYPAGIALSPDGRTLYAAENLADSVAVVDLASRRVVQRLATERYPYGVVVGPDGTVYASAWGGSTVSIFPTRGNGMLREGTRARVGRHPSALTLNPGGSRLFVASGSTDRVTVLDTRTQAVIATLNDATPAGTGEGSTPNALAVSADGARLFVAEADNNAVGVFDLSLTTAGSSAATGSDALSGRIPVGWYPSAVAADGTDLLVISGKGRGTGPNSGHGQPGQPMPALDYTLGQINGTLTIIPAAKASPSELAAFSDRVASANGWNATRREKKYPPFEHVIYVIKENRTYDQVLGDLPQADGDPSLVFFPRAVSPNHHALAERFGIFDRFFVNAEVSPDGHNWSMAAYVTDYAEKTIPSNYSSRGRSYDYEGFNRGVLADDDVSEPSSGYLWNLADHAGITYRNYGEFVDEPDEPTGLPAPAYTATKPSLRAHTNSAYPGWSLQVPDQVRADIWLKEFQEFVRAGKLPALEFVRLPNDHTSGARAGSPTPRAYMADNDLALGRIIEALTKSPFWKSTVVFVLEDDAQDGPDHVDSHRSPLLVISPYNRGKVFHRFANTTDVLATIEDILGLGRMSQFDHYGRPLREIWETTPDLTAYVALKPSVPLDEKNPKRGVMVEASKKLTLEKEDTSNDDLFNRILWSTIKGDQPYPGTKRMSALEARVSR
ncbi:MAG: SMP-30/gluconolactonase/LRE family protein [Gemmatimonadota bacterium]|nr:SMP-30/gluconolactonase/LRE family protein [Gemmatimonadota bacterium]